jgi:DNA-binding PadR family transcriptional regulator
MSLPLAILGLLQNEPMTGYDLKTRAFDQSIAHFWPADQAQIYRTLDKMTEVGWVESHLERQDDRPNRKVYRITDMGRAELHRWLLEPQPLPTNRQPFLIQVFFAKELPNEQIINLMEQQLELHQAQLARYRKIPLPPLGDPSLTRDQTLRRLTLESGIKVEEARIAWLKEAIKVVRQLKE